MQTFFREMSRSGGKKGSRGNGACRDGRHWETINREKGLGAASLGLTSISRQRKRVLLLERRRKCCDNVRGRRLGGGRATEVHNRMVFAINGQGSRELGREGRDKREQKRKNKKRGEVWAGLTGLPNAEIGFPVAPRTEDKKRNEGKNRGQLALSF